MGEDRNTRLIWEVVGRLDLRLYYGEIAAVEGHGGRDLVTNSGHEFPALCASRRLWPEAFVKQQPE